MKSTSEVGHGKNIANLEDLISQCTSFGASYNPASTNLQLANLNTLKTNADTAMLASLNAKTGVTTFRWTQKLRLTALSLTNEKSKQSLQFRI